VQEKRAHMDHTEQPSKVPARVTPLYQPTWYYNLEDSPLLWPAHWLWVCGLVHPAHGGPLVHVYGKGLSVEGT